MALIDNIILALKCDDDAASTKVVDSTTTNDASLVGGDNTEDISVPGLLGNALNLNGIDDYITTDANSVVLNDFSISMLVNADAWGETMIYSMGYNADDSFLFFVTATDKLGAFIDGGGYTSVIDPPSTGNWHQLGFSRNGTTGKFYVDGSEVDSTAVSSQQIAALKHEVGFAAIRNKAGTYLNGKVQHVYLFDADIGPEGFSGLWNEGAGFAYPFAVGTNMKINIADAWKDIDSLKLNIGDAWKNVIKIQQNIGDVWKDVYG